MSRWYSKIEAGWTPEVIELMNSRYPYSAEEMSGSVVSFHDSKGLKVSFIYNRYSPPDICIHVVARENALWCHEDILWHVFHYPFDELCLSRVTVPVLSDNKASLRMVEAIGFTYEGTLRKAGRNGQDIKLYGMLKDECHWLKRKAA